MLIVLFLKSRIKTWVVDQKQTKSRIAHQFTSLLRYGQIMDIENGQFKQDA